MAEIVSKYEEAETQQDKPQTLRLRENDETDERKEQRDKRSDCSLPTRSLMAATRECARTLPMARPDQINPIWLIGIFNSWLSQLDMKTHIATLMVV